MSNRIAFLMTVLALVVTGCAKSGGDSVASTGKSPAPGPVTQTVQVTLRHGLGYVCLYQENPVSLYCWASEQAAIDNGDAGRVGLTSTVPELLWSQPGTSNILAIYNHGLCYGEVLPAGGGTIPHCVGNLGSGTFNVYEETRSCDVTALDTLHCAGEAVPDLTFAGLVFQ